MKTVKIALDAFPYEPRLHRVCDYGGMQIFAKLALPLFIDQQGKLTPLAAHSLESNEDGKTLTIRLRKDLRWSNGETVNAEHYAEAFRQICGDPSNRFHSLLSDLAGYVQCAQGDSAALGVQAIDSHCLQLTLRNRNHWFAWLLCQLHLSPWHSDPHLSAGPYTIAQQNLERFVLVNNPYYFQKQENGVGRLEFVNYEGHTNRADSITDYYAGEIDVSCDTVMFFEDFAKHHGQSDFHWNWPPLGMFLSVGILFKELPLALRQNLHAMLDRQSLAAALYNVPRPINGYLDLYEYGASQTPSEPASNITCNIVISYEDFYPNRQVAEMLQQQLARYDVLVQLQENRFGDWSNASHLRLTVQANNKFGPLNFYKSDILRGLFEGADAERIRKLYSLYLQLSDANQSRQVALEIEKMLHGHGLSVPLLAIPSAALIRPGLCADSIYQVGVPILYNANFNVN